MPRTILLADDSITIQKVVELTLVEGGYEVASFDNGDDALGRIDALAPDLVIADIHMPGATGYELARHVKRGTPATPVLLLVGTFEPFDEAEVEASGADGFLMKPFDSQELLARVEGLLPTSASEVASPADDEPEPSMDSQAPVELAAAEPAEAAVEVPGETPSVAAESTSLSQGTLDGGASVAPAGLSDEDIDRIARRVVAAITPEIVREVAREIVPEIAELVVRERIQQLEQDVE